MGEARSEQVSAPNCRSGRTSRPGASTQRCVEQRGSQPGLSNNTPSLLMVTNSRNTRIPMNHIDLKAEMARVLGEIEMFRDECLPAMLPEPTVAGMPERASPPRGHKIEEGASHAAWVDAACQLADALRSSEFPICAEAFREFARAATTSWRYREGCFRWRIELFAVFDGALLWYPGVKEEQQRLSASADWPTEHRIEIESRLLSLYARSPRHIPGEDCALWNALCLVLPWIADVDPAFATMALDKDTWRTLTVTNHALTAEQRSDRLRLIDGYFGHVLNNALLHVLGALANNHFRSIRDYINHPNLRGRYTYHMPYYLFTVLFEKVAVLRSLACDDR
jgi:hypothetical protein